MKVFSKLDDDSLIFECPGCGSPHRISYGEGPGPRWAWNGSYEVPTIHPSILVRYDHWVPPATDAEILAKINTGEIEQVKVSEICHSFITDGKIQFLGDCTHSLAGQTVPLPVWDDAS